MRKKEKRDKVLNICLVGPTYPFKGGISHYTTLLFENLKKQHNVSFFAFSRLYPKFLFPGDSSGDTSKKLIEDKKILKIIDWANPFSWIYTGLKIKKIKPDLLVLPWWMWGWAIPFYVICKLAKNKKTKIVFICHNVVEHETAGWKKLLTKLALNVGDNFLVHSDIDIENLEKLIPRSIVMKVKMPVFDLIKKIKISKEEAKKKLGLEEKKIILFFGYVRKYKGLRVLIKSIPGIVNKIPDLVLVVAGEFWEDKEEYIKLIEKLGVKNSIFIFDRYISDEEVPEFFIASDFLVLPYLSATGSAVTKLAISFEKPIIATNVGDLPETVENGRRGFIVKKRSSRELIHAVIKMYGGGMFKKFSDNIKKDKSLFSWNNLVTIIEHL